MALIGRAVARALSDTVAAEDRPRATEYRRAIAEAERAWVFDQDGHVVAVAAMSAPDLLLLYVDPPAQGAGVGRLLHDHVLAQARSAGATGLRLRLCDRDRQGRAFYEGRGWAAPTASGAGPDQIELRIAL